MPDSTMILFIGLVCALFGALVGGAISGMRRPPETPPADPNLEELLRVQRDKRTGKLRVEMDNRPLGLTSGLTTAQRQNLALIINNLETRFALAPTPPAPQPDASEFPPVGEELFTQPAPTSLSGTVKYPSMKPVDVLARAIFSSTSKAPVPERSIAAQVDEILQERLADTPLAKSGIRLIETPNQGILVRVGLNQYEGIDSVPDPEVRQAIRSAVEEWERRAAGNS
jgi:hypothetical protein